MYGSLNNIVLHFLAEFGKVSAVAGNTDNQGFVFVRLDLRSLQGIAAHHVELNVVNVEVYEGTDNLYDSRQSRVAFDTDRIQPHVEQGSGSMHLVVDLGNGFEYGCRALMIRSALW